MTKKPPYLQKGDLIEIISTARKISLEEINPAKEILECWGFKVRFGKNLFKSDHQFAGTDAHRLEDIQHAIDDDAVKAILCARGGYGTVRIVDGIDWHSFLNQPKWIIGFSDVTVLHLHLNVLRVESLHATMPILFTQSGNEKSLESLKNTLLGKPEKYSFPFHPLNIIGKSSGEVIGGNLSIINQLIGTPSFPDLTAKILFIEDLDEYLYHIDRMMYQLKRAGVFNQIKGLIIGHMSDMNDNTIPYGKDVLEIISEHVKDYKFPVAFNLPVGHEADNRALICGKEMTLTVTDTESILA